MFGLGNREREVLCSKCGDLIGRGENLGFSSALCVKCGDELYPQFKKEKVDTPPPKWIRPEPLPEPFVTSGRPVDGTQSPQPKSDPVAIAVFEETDDMLKKKPKQKLKKPTKPQHGKSVVKAIKSLTRLKP